MPKSKKITPHSTLLHYASWVLLGFLTTAAVGVSILNITLFLDKQKVLGVSAQSEETSKEIAVEKEQQFWKNIIANVPTYRDAYIELAAIAHSAGYKDQVIHLLQQADSIDPNSEMIKALKEKFLK